MEVSSGAAAYDTSVLGAGDSRSYMYVGAGGFAGNVTISAADLYVEGNATTSATVSGVMVDTFGGLTVLENGIASAVTVNSAGTEYLSGGNGYAGQNINGTINSGGILVVASGGVDYAASITGGVNVYYGGVDSAGTVFGGGNLTVYSGGAVYSATVDNGGAETLSGATGYATTNSAGTINAGGNLYISSGGADYGTTINGGGGIYVDAGGSDSGSTIQGAAYVGGNTYDETVDASGQMYIYSGGVDSGSSVGSGSYIFVEDGGMDSGSTITYGGFLVVDSGGQDFGATITSAGASFINAGGSDSGSTVDYGGGINVSSGATIYNPTISGGLLYVASGAILSGGIFFAGGGALQLGAGELTPSVAVYGFNPNASIELEQLTSNTSVSLVVTGDTATVTSGGTTYNVDIFGASSMDLYLAGDGSGDTYIEAGLCYLRGTNILTPTGAVPVESLQIGDLVVTRFNNFQPVKWIGRQSYDSRITRADSSQIPVRTRAGALAPNQPARDLYVSPGHSMLIGNTLVLASSLVNGVTITQDDAPETIEYFQIELAMHDCIIAEGAWSETFADGPGLREQFHNHAEFSLLYPQHRPPETVSLCAPRPESGEKLAAAIAPIAARAAAGLPAGKLRGVFEKIEMDWKISGWAMDESYPDLPVLLEVVAEDGVIGTVLACDFRADLQAAGLGRGRCAFTFNAPERLRPEQLASLQIRRAADGAPLWSMAGAAAPAKEAPRQGLRLVA
jgi:autotransporter passenger strand-loop-strand repeat protein